MPYINQVLKYGHIKTLYIIVCIIYTLVTVKQLTEIHISICNNARSLIEKKGKDYSGLTQSIGGDTLSNLRLPKELKIVKYNTQTILTRLAEKYARLVSLTTDPNINPEVKDETVSDTIEDCINFLVYLKVFYDEERNKYKPDEMVGKFGTEVKHTEHGCNCYDPIG